MVQAAYFDGRSARAVEVRVEIVGEELLIHARDGSLHRTEPLEALRWPERQRHGPRVLHLPDGASLQAADAAAWDDWKRLHGLGESIVVRAQQSWRGTAVAVVVLVLLACAGYLWGLPWAGAAVVRGLPESVDARIGAAAYESLQRDLLKPSALGEQRREALRARFEQAVARAAVAGAPPRFELRFHAAAQPNAFALPGGTLVLTDALVERLAGHDDTIIGVLGHELGHAERRHGMRMLVQATLLGAATALAFGDLSGWLGTLPALLGQLAYSRDFEREADEHAIALLAANRIDPAVMLVLFDRLDRDGHDAGGGVFATHPGGAERRARFEAASRFYNRAP